jgi:hypothetical protein
MNTNILAQEVLSGGQSSKVTLSVASAQGPVITRPTDVPKGVPIKCLMTGDVPFWMRKGTNPTAVADGTDQYVPANTPIRVELMEGERIAAIAAGAGNLYFTPGA